MITVVCAPSGHVPTFKCFKVLSLNSNSYSPHSAHTMPLDGDDPDLEAFESNFCAIIRARELGKNAAVVSNFYPNASESRLVGVSSQT